MGSRQQKRSAPNWEALAILRLASVGLLEALWGLLSWPFARRTEEVCLTYHPTYENKALLAGCPALKNFSCSPWAPGPHAQTFFSIIKLGPRPVPRKEEVVMPDGVQITLLWFEPKDAAADAPLVVSLHGIGGDENSVRPIMLAEECLRRNWRSVLYVRRGHGNSSLLPVGETAPAASPPAGLSPGGPGAAKAAAAVATAAAEVAAGAVERIAAAAVAESAAACAAASSGEPVKAPPHQAATASATATTVTIVATEAGDDDSAANVVAAAAAVAVSPAGAGAADLDSSAPSTPVSPAVSMGCLPKNIGLPPAFQMAADSVDVRAAAVAAADPETLRRTRKAFPQHADTEDLMVVLQHIRAARPQAIMVAVGFSMGSNVLVKFLGEHPPAASTPRPTSAAAAPATASAAATADAETGTAATASTQAAAATARREEDPKNPLAAAISISNGYDIIEGTRHMVTSRPLADRIITGALHKLLRRKLPEVHAICAAHGVLVDFDEVLACSTIRDFERALMVPICGLGDVDEYYRHNNCRDEMMNVRTPLLCLSARDDPIIDPSLLRHAEAAAAANPHVILALTRRGGHLGWLQGWAGKSWMMDVIVQYVESVARLHAQRACGAAEGNPAAAPVGGKAAAQTVAITEGGGAAGGIGLRAFDSCFGCGTASVDALSGEVTGRRSVDVMASAATKGATRSVAAAREQEGTHGSAAAAPDVVISLRSASRSATTATADRTITAAATATGA